MTMSANTLLRQQQQQHPPSPPSGDLAASIDTLPPRRGQDLFGVGGIPIGRPGPAGHSHSRTKSKTDFLDLADSSTRLSNSPEVNARLEQKRAEHERQRAEQKQAFAAQMRALAAQHESEERELLGVPVSAPTTPPRSEGDSERMPIVDHHRHRTLAPNQYGNIGVTKTSAFREFANNSKSVPASRRHSGQEDELLGLDKLTLGSSIAAPFAKNVIRHPHKLPNQSHDAPSVTSFLFDDELDSDLQHPTFGGKYLQMNTDDDKFPILVRRDSFPGMLSASSAALDLAPLAQTPPRHSNLTRPTTTSRGSDWSPFDSPSAYRPLPHSQIVEGDRSRLGSQTQVPTPVSFHPDARGSPVSERGASPRLARVVHMNGTSTSRTPSSLSGPNTTANGGSSSSGGTTAVTSSLMTNSNVTSPVNEKKPISFLPPRSPVDMQSVLGQGYASNDLNSIRSPISVGSNLRGDSNYGIGAGYAINGSRALDSSFGQYASAGLNSAPGNVSSAGLGGFGFDSADGYGLNGSGANGSMFLNKAAAVVRGRDPETNRFANIRLEDMQGDMFGLCKDQHGCRFLQKKLEEGEPTHRDMIFAEIYPHFGELMTDAFGNYLSQKLLEYSTDEQRDLLIESISGELVSISLNMHGTRAVQKMIDFLSTQRQIQSLIIALNLNVVTLIKDLNGNHVIQKCLNHLPPEDNQFIYNAVAANCIEVATHRHGCCVLQRCIDHASESQRIQLVTEITYNSLTLVQDPFGNYVVQYVLDLNDSRFIEAIVRQFLGNVCALSMQKFSSNVVEKCIRVSDPSGRRALIEELSGRQRLERLLRDSFANYVVQTALDYSDPAQRAQLVDNIRPILPMIRNTPYGKRIQSKIQRESMDPLRGATGYHPSMVAGGFFMAPPNMATHHHIPPLLDTRHSSSFIAASSPGAPNPASHQLLSAHAHHHQTPGGGPPFVTPWVAATSPTGAHIPISYGLALNQQDHQATSYAPFM